MKESGFERKFEIRDPIYRFVEIEKDELPILNHWAFQRLRHIRQLGPTYLVYPGANHTRFEHSLGVMHISSTVFDKMWDKGLSKYITHTDKNKDKAEESELHEFNRKFYRKALRLAAMLHDLGHPPFSHAGEDVMPELKPGQKADHEHYTVAGILETGIADLIREIGDNKEFGGQRGQEMLRTVLGSITSAEVLDDLNVPNELRTTDKATQVINEILTGELGTDRIDYLLRDSYYTGTRYGEFDYWRLMDTFMVVPREVYEEWSRKGEGSRFFIGVSTDGLHAAEALIIARYHMFLQVYFHKTRRILDYHYARLLKMSLKEFPPPENIREYLELDDPAIISLFREKTREDSDIKKEYGRLFMRRHLRLYETTHLSIDKKSAKKVVKNWMKIYNKLENAYYIDDAKKMYGVTSLVPGGMKFPVYDPVENSWYSPEELPDYSRLAQAGYHIILPRLYLDPCDSDALSLLKGKFSNKEYSFCDENKGGKP